MKTIEDMNRLVGQLPVPLPPGPYMEATPPPMQRPEAQFPAWMTGAHQFAMQQFLKAFAERQREPAVPSWQMPYPMPATQSERDVLGMLPVAGDVEDMRYLMEGVHEGDPAKAAMGGAAALMPFVPASLLHTVYHGSPHLFDQFSMSKIGTGEGAQAYGHGLYFAESPGVAKEYQSAALNPQIDAINDRMRELAREMEKYSSGGYRQFNDPRGHELAKEYDQLMQEKLAFKGSFYKVEIPDEAVGRMLDWDKPLSEQPWLAEGTKDEIIARVRAEGRKPTVAEIARVNLESPSYGDPSGRVFYKDLAQKLGSEQAASEALRQAGIPGIRYLDQMSRGAQEGTRNLVLFDESLAKILERK